MPAVVSDLVLVLAIVANGLLAGVYFGFVCAIRPAMRLVDDVTYVATCRSINIGIVNGWFLLAFCGAPLLAVTTAVLDVWDGRESLVLLVVAAVLAVVTFAITVAANIPLNNALDRAAVGTDEERRRARQNFEDPWIRWHLARTVAGIAAFVLLGVAALP